jgi:anti-sigma factor RsiW
MSDGHETVEPLLSAYLDGELDAERRRLVEAHLATCAICRETLDALRAGDDALAALVPTPAAPALGREFRRRLRRRSARSGLTACLIVLAGLIVRGLRPEVKLVRRQDLPRWFRLTRTLSLLLLLASLSSLFWELLRDVRALAEYAWLSGEEHGEDQ